MLWAAMNTEEPVCCCEDPVQPNEYFQKLNLYLVCLSHLVTVYQLLVLIQLTCAVFSLFSRVQLFVILWTVAHQTPLSWDSPGRTTGVGCRALHHDEGPETP